ncbi:hypothetical protein M885DRAFT_545061 [Pelagophyceae sp. CCMP2097]|nr:hypothetical protein M885DRAFT_545061 [Pelagophyceae sp. CCMP2097]|mmetsp:Transcript_8514/g.28037  ORF Transcript_8514/g.28037 Transcript_8514/m.28037 type:complete len:195 (-) Transcript_8514:17-601(-)
MQENSAKLAYLFGHHRGCSRRRSGEDRHALDVDITRARSDAPDGRLSNFFYEGGFQTNSYSSTADCAIDAGIVDEAKLRLTTKPKCESHGLSQEGCDAVLRISKDMCREHFAAGHVELDGSTTRSFSIPLLFIFQDREDFVLTVDGAEIILSIDAETDVSTYSAEICSKYHLKPDDQRVLLQALRGIQPPKYYK